MSVKEINKTIIISDGLTGQIIDNIPYCAYCTGTLRNMISDIFLDYCCDNDRGLIIKIGYNSK